MKSYNIEQVTYNKEKITKNKNLFYVLCYMFYTRKGFTLIEVMVAATLVALLSTMGISGYQAITRNGRDALRKSDLEQIRSALEIYKSENNSYPVEDSCSASASLVSSYINTYPADPKAGSYSYCYHKLTGTTYTLCAHLENGQATDYSAECGGDNKCISNCNYKVSNP